MRHPEIGNHTTPDTLSSFMRGMFIAGMVAVAGCGGGVGGAAATDTTAPAFSSGTAANVAENTATSTTVYDATADADSGVTYTHRGTDAAQFNFNAATGEVTFKNSPDYENPVDQGGNNAYDITLTATDAAGNATSHDVAITVTNVSNGTGVHANTDGTNGDFNDVIDLDSYGKLIAPVYVDGNWYYYWDRSGNGYSDGVDETTHNVLDGIFTQDINGNVGGDGNTTDTYRYATLNGVKVVLPTHGEASVTTGYRPGTVIDNSPAGEANSAYDGLLAIWDGYNGTGTGTNIYGKPPGWQAIDYWSATPSTNGHAHVNLIDGNVYDGYDTYGNHVALQVL